MEEEKSNGDGRGGGMLSDAGDEEVDVKELRVSMRTGGGKQKHSVYRGGSRGHGVRCGAELTRRRANTHTVTQRCQVQCHVLTERDELC